MWDVPSPPGARGATAAPPLDACGFKRGLEKEYAFVTSAPDLGQGGFGRVRLAVSRATGEEVAVKSIAKRLDLPGVAPQRQRQHVGNIAREVAVLRRLRGCLNVVRLVDAFEDDADAHIVMECCRGGELVHRIGARAYTEKTVSSIALAESGAGRARALTRFAFPRVALTPPTPQTTPAPK